MLLKAHSGQARADMSFAAYAMRCRFDMSFVVLIKSLMFCYSHLNPRPKYEEHAVADYCHPRALWVEISSMDRSQKGFQNEPP